VSNRQYAKSPFRGCDGVLICFSLTDRESFANVANWIKETRLFCSHSIRIIVLGTKCDDIINRKVDSFSAERLCLSYKCEYFEISSKKDQFVQLAFATLLQQIVNLRTGNSTLRSGSTLRSASSEKVTTEIKNTEKIVTTDPYLSSKCNIM